MIGIWLLVVLSIILFAIAAFLGKELLKKFKFHDQFTSSEGYLQKVTHYWPGDSKPMMRNIILRASEPFKILIGFKLTIPLLNFEGTDWFGFTEAQPYTDGGYYSVISTYMGKGPAEFRLLVNSASKNDVSIILQSQEQTFKPHLVCSPHWYQRIGFYG